MTTNTLTKPIALETRLFAASVNVAESGRAILHWTDFVANDWTETFDSLDAAVARLALLIHAVEADATFAEDDDEFEASWNEFRRDRF